MVKFVLNEYHRNVSDEELIEDVVRVAKKLKKTTLTAKEYTLNGTYHSSTLSHRFGSWKKVLELSSLTIKGHNFKYTFSDEDVIEDLKRVAFEYKKETLTSNEYSKYGRCHGDTLSRRYGTWNKVLELAGLKNVMNRNFTNEDLFVEIERVWTLLGRQPTTTDIKNGISKYSLNSYARRFGGWRSALQAFVDYIYDESESNKDSFDKTEKVDSDNNNKEIKVVKKGVIVSKQHITGRDVNLRLRFKVLQRDNFKCCSCGASPAKDPSVELHVDHIIPWSKGGETTMENLQTLCSKCNLGKSDLV